LRAAAFRFVVLFVAAPFLAAAERALAVRVDDEREEELDLRPVDLPPPREPLPV
jgi:hypothetical protein